LGSKGVFLENANDAVHHVVRPAPRCRQGMGPVFPQFLSDVIEFSQLGRPDCVVKIRPAAAFQVKALVFEIAERYRANPRHIAPRMATVRGSATRPSGRSSLP